MPTFMTAIGNFVGTLGDFMNSLGFFLGQDVSGGLAWNGTAWTHGPNNVADWMDGVLETLTAVLAPVGLPTGGMGPGTAGLADVVTSLGNNLLGGLGMYLQTIAGSGGIVESILKLL